MNDESRTNEALAGHRDAEDHRRREVEELAERLYIAAYGGWYSRERLDSDGLRHPSMHDALLDAEQAITERDRRREQVKR